MPELPEVETVKNSLKNYVLNRKILKVDVLYKGIINYPSVKEFIEKITNQTILDVKRRGKYLVFVLEDYNLISHLKMEGKYFIKDKYEITKHDHVIFTLDNNKYLIYNDTRKFGKMYLINKEYDNNSPLNILGLEPWDKELTISYLKDKLNRNIAIKTLLLDQTIIVGIGNIYADEILFLSKINPLRKGYTLTNLELENIIKYTKEVLEKAISQGGTTIRTYSSVNGIHGLFQQELLVHGKTSNCPICQEQMLKIRVGGRGTYYCNNCQK